VTVWVVFVKITEVGSTDNWAASFHGKIDALTITKIGLGYILGDFFYKRIWSPCSAEKSNYLQSVPLL
jgi:hypothetical protein